jgi:hypothetical protein
MKHYEARWSTSLIVMSVLATVVCAGVGVAAWLSMTAQHVPGAISWVSVLPVLILLGAVPFTIRGYGIGSDCILVHRLWWSTVLPRAGMVSAVVERDAMRGSLRTFGNGGAFSITGFYYNRRLGSYRAFVTDPHRTVVLRYASRRVVLSPDKPEEFVEDLALGRP